MIFNMTWEHELFHRNKYPGYLITIPCLTVLRLSNLTSVIKQLSKKLFDISHIFLLVQSLLYHYMKNLLPNILFIK